jgi:hypothetical protein
VLCCAFYRAESCSELWTVAIYRIKGLYCIGGWQWNVGFSRRIKSLRLSACFYQSHVERENRTLKVNEPADWNFKARCWRNWPTNLFVAVRSTAARLRGLWVLIPPGEWMSVLNAVRCTGWCLCDGLITRPEESYSAVWIFVLNAVCCTGWCLCDGLITRPEESYSAVFLNRRAAARYRALA